MAKYTPAQAEAMERYREKALKRYLFELRYDQDQDIIDSIQEAMENGITKRQWLSDLFHCAEYSEGYISKSEACKLLRDRDVGEEIVSELMEL